MDTFGKKDDVSGFYLLVSPRRRRQRKLIERRDTIVQVNVLDCSLDDSDVWAQLDEGGVIRLSMYDCGSLFGLV